MESRVRQFLDGLMSLWVVLWKELRSTCAWIKELRTEVSDAEDYQRWRLEKAMEQLNKFIVPVCVALIGGLQIHFFSGRLSWLTNVVLSLLVIFIMVGACQAAAHIRSNGPIEGFILLQIGMFATMHALMFYFAQGMTTNLLQHRVYITATLGLLHLMLQLGYVPFIYFVGIVCPISVISWTAFHIVVVEYWTLSVFWFGVQTAVCSSIFHCILDSTQRATHSAKCALADEQQYLDATQACLHSMVLSCFEAACICDSAGNVSCWVQAGQELSLQAESLHELGLGAEEQRRVRRFLMRLTVKSSAGGANCVEHAQILMDIGQHCKVKLSGIILPSRRSGVQRKHLSISNGGLLVGFQIVERPKRPAGDNLPNETSLIQDEAKPFAPDEEELPFFSSKSERKDGSERTEATNTPPFFRSRSEGTEEYHPVRGLRERAAASGMQLTSINTTSSATRCAESESHDFESRGYRILERLNRGSSCRVVKAARVEDGHLVALKISSQEHATVVKDEFELLRSCEHPHIARAIDHINMACASVLVLEFYEGFDLEVAVQKLPQSRLEEGNVRLLFRYLLQAVNHLHCLRIVHRDIKPSNIRVSPDLRDLHLLDFNTSKRLSQGASLTMTGTRLYTAPEVWEGWSPPSESNDVWACGICLHLMLSGQMPWKGERKAACPVVNFNEPKWTYISKPCQSVLRQCLTKDPLWRPAVGTLLFYEWFWMSGTTDPSQALEEVIQETPEMNNMLKRRKFNQKKVSSI
eukprot:TRINITY_DN35196_c0_g1_i1.p1 TRINITY_DN35196_c0_g1~~TRINITY_DN35196_c0_g1_i1.p1  ORF type:complete len:753 (-),score=100.44 TRINITY_DN35196_c0_g1_i1:39-2297(-)